jgi:hypothetical protein
MTVSFNIVSFLREKFRWDHITFAVLREIGNNSSSRRCIVILSITGIGPDESRKYFLLFVGDTNAHKEHRYKIHHNSQPSYFVQESLEWVNITDETLGSVRIVGDDDTPPNLSKHSSVTLYTGSQLQQETIVIFGGLYGSTPCVSCLYLLSYFSSNSSFSWRRATLTLTPTRYAHTAVAANYWRTMLVFGGLDGNRELTNRLDEFILDSLKWSVIDASNPPEGISSKILNNTLTNIHNREI